MQPRGLIIKRPETQKVIQVFFSVNEEMKGWVIWNCSKLLCPELNSQMTHDLNKRNHHTLLNGFKIRYAPQGKGSKHLTSVISLIGAN